MRAERRLVDLGVTRATCTPCEPLTRAGGGLPPSGVISGWAVLVTAALAGVAVGVVGWPAGSPAVATGLGACGVLALIFGAGVYIRYWRVRPGAEHKSPR
jgi:hypothetical protein